MKKYPPLIACLTVINPKKSIEFYTKAFGFTHANPGEDYTEMRYNDVVIMFGQEGMYGQTNKAPKTSGVECPIVLYIYVDHVDNFYKNALRNGAISVMEPQTTHWGDKICALKDIDGYQWTFAKTV